MSYVKLNGKMVTLNDKMVVKAPSSTYPSALANRHFWYDPTDLTTITKDGSDIVSRVNDKLGNGNDLVTGSCEWTGNTLLFDGFHHYLKTGAIAAMQQPTMIYMIVKQISWFSGSTFFDGIIGNSGRFMQSGISSDVALYAGSYVRYNDNLLIDTWSIARLILNGANSSLQINETTPITGDVGAGNMLGFTLAAKGGFSYKSNIQVKDVIAMPSDEAETEIYDWLVTRL